MPASMTFQFLDVGQGDGTLVKMRADPDPGYDELALIDFGEDKTQFKVPIEDALTYLVDQIADSSYARGKETPYVDHLYLTHPHKDHYSGLPQLLAKSFPKYSPEKKLRFGRLSFGGDEGDYEGGLITNLVDNHLEVKPPDQLEKNAAATITPATGGDPASLVPNWEFADKKVKVYLLSANYGGKKASDKNDTSLVLLFELEGGQRVCLQGDAGKRVEAHILRKFAGVKLNVVALKLGHHGSKGSSSAAWISALQPKYAFASGDFAYGGHPFCETLRRVDENTTLATVLKPSPVRFCCGRGGGQYSNNETGKACCMNLWYVVKRDFALFSTTDREVPFIYGRKDAVYGVQWGLELRGNQLPQLELTDYVTPLWEVNYRKKPFWKAYISSGV